MTRGGDQEFARGTWVALIAGGGPWSADDRRQRGIERMVAALETFAFAGTLATVWRSTQWEGTVTSRVPALVCTAAVVALALPVAVRAIGRHWPATNVTVLFVVRAALIATATLSMFAVLPGWNSVMIAPLAVALGADASLTACDLGWRARPIRWWRDFLVSWFHFGVLGALAAATVIDGDERAMTALRLYAAMHVAVALFVITAGLLAAAIRQVDVDRDDFARSIVERERRERAHWLHDDVCSLVRLASLKVQTQRSSADELLDILEDLDHNLRLRQLDELIGGGPARVAEVLQPYIRHAQNLGITIERVPSFDEAATTLTEHDARLLARAAAGFTSNALNAGATRLAFDVTTDDRAVHLRVTDDGPGFDLADIPVGRGLWSLMQDLGTDALQVCRDADRCAVTAAIPLTDRRSRVDDPAHR